MNKLLDTFFEYVAVREQRERVMTWIGVSSLVMAIGYAVAVVAYVNLR
ncbi:hypothetical protein GJ699_30450 [Duganella sp. FT80W]|uniref:Uncharacterized protein n=1 Tax=Duganella guangzhouensis TaxID=2666084 RepID=A0A6I2L7U5_9BURK|nr:hypothetical protein [Duganella guangzhouensis]MRW94305.1 hypothetical protein [Duganella guangzhouensis]